jgi:hypothetical protein
MEMGFFLVGDFDGFFFAMPHHTETERVATKSFQLGLLPGCVRVLLLCYLLLDRETLVTERKNDGPAAAHVS